MALQKQNLSVVLNLKVTRRRNKKKKKEDKRNMGEAAIGSRENS